MPTRYPVLWLCGISFAGAAAAIALLFTHQWLAVAGYAASAAGLAAVLSWLVNRG